MHLIMIMSFFTLALTGMTLKFSYMALGAGLSQGPRRLRDHGRAPPARRGDADRLFASTSGTCAAQEGRRARPGSRFIFGPELASMFNLQRPQGVRRLDQVVLRPRAAARATGATPTGRSSTTSRCSGASASSARPASCSGSRSSSPAFLPGWSINVATIIHSDEALLAVGLHLHHPLLQHPLPAGQVPDGPGDLHRPRAARGAQVRQAARVRGDHGEATPVELAERSRPGPSQEIESAASGSSASWRWPIGLTVVALIVYRWSSPTGRSPRRIGLLRARGRSRRRRTAAVARTPS